MGEYYPFHQLANTDTKNLAWSPWNEYGACTSNVTGSLNGFVLQQDFGWTDNDSDDASQGTKDYSDGDGDWVPDGTQSGGEWQYALGCTTSYDEPMGTF
jgi:hypothetical protein